MTEDDTVTCFRNTILNSTLSDTLGVYKPCIWTVLGGKCFFSGALHCKSTVVYTLIFGSQVHNNFSIANTMGITMYVIVKPQGCKMKYGIAYFIIYFVLNIEQFQSHRPLWCKSNDTQGKSFLASTVHAESPLCFMKNVIVSHKYSTFV